MSKPEGGPQCVERISSRSLPVCACSCARSAPRKRPRRPMAGSFSQLTNTARCASVRIRLRRCLRAARRRHAHAARLRRLRGRRHGVGARDADHRRPARRMDACANPGRVDGPRGDARRPAGCARRRSAAAGAARRVGAARPSRSTSSFRWLRRRAPNRSRCRRRPADHAGAG